jgi:hypothetical protein
MNIQVDGGWTDSVGDGWTSLVQPLIDRCQAERVKILQVKEKFGGLRFYIGGGSEELNKAIAEAESQSYKTCEDCGSTDGVTTSAGGRYWLRSLCPACHAKRA